MKKIKKKFEKSNFIFEQLKRVGEFAIYSRYNKDFKKETLHYEVIIIKSHNGYTIAGKNLPPAEIYPSSSSWGSLGFTFSSLNEAEKKLQQLIKSKNARKR